MRSPARSVRSGLRSFRGPWRPLPARASFAMSFFTQTSPGGPPVQDPGWTVAVPGLTFLVLAAVVWWIWRRLAD